MTIVRRIAKGYAVMAVISLVLVTWLGYHEFVEEPREFAALGMINVHKDTDAELSTVCFLAAMPLLLGLGWWWTRNSLAPLTSLAEAVGEIDTHNLLHPLPRGRQGDEVEQLSTAFNAMAGRLDASFRRIQEFTLHASHELKTPLTVMRGHLETTLRENRALPPEQTAWIDDELDEIKRLTHIVDALTLLTKADAGLIQLLHDPIELHELLEEAYEDARVLAHPHGLEVRLGECSPTLISGDRHRLRQLLLILTDNAVKYNRPGGTLEFSVVRSDGTAELRVTNTGPGLKPESVKKVFDRFVRGENGSSDVEGCGLGLNIARWIVEAHDGSISLTSAPGAETTVCVRLPCLSESRAKHHESARSPAWDI